MKRAKCFVDSARTLEGKVSADDVNDVIGGDNLVDGFWRNDSQEWII